MKACLDSRTLDHLLDGEGASDPEMLLPLHHDGIKLLSLGIVFADLGNRLAGIGLIKPYERLSNSLRPIIERAERIEPSPLFLPLRDVPSAQDSEGSGDEAPALGPGGRNRIDIEGARLR